MPAMTDFTSRKNYAYQYGQITDNEGNPVDQAGDTYHMIVLYAPRPIQIWNTLPGSDEIGVQVVRLDYHDIPIPGRLNAELRGLSDVFTRTDPCNETGCAFYEYCRSNARACICLEADARHASLTDAHCPAVARMGAAGTYQLQSINTPINNFRNAADLKPLGRYEKYYDLFPCHPELRKFQMP